MKNALLNFWKKHRRAIIVIGILTIAATILLPHLAFAQATPAPPSSDEDKLVKDIITFLSLLMKWAQRVLWPVLLMIGGLMNNDLLFGAGMEERSLLIWQNIRNLVNVLFVLIMLAIALYNIVGGQNQGWQLKAILPKFVIALIAVNFSFIGLKVVLDGVNVVSTAIFAMPDSVKEGLSEVNSDTKKIDKNVCQGLYGIDTVDYENAVKEAGENALCNIKSTTFTDKGKFFFARFGAQNAAMVLAISYGKIADYNKVKIDETTTTKLAINMFFSVIFYLIYAVSFVALMLVLLVRVIVLWLLLVLSPLAALTMVLPDELKKSLGEASDLKDKFVQHAIVPIPIALVMTIGFILLDGFNKSVLPGVSLNTSTLGVGLLVSGVSTFQELIIAIAGVGFIWTGVFAAADKTMAKGLTGKLKTMTEGAGKFISTSWQYAPFIQVKGATDEKGKPLKVSLAGAMGMGQQMMNAREMQATTESSNLAKGYGNYQALQHANDMSARGIDGDITKFKQGMADSKDLMTTAPMKKGMSDAMRHVTIRTKVTEELKGTEIRDNLGNIIAHEKLAEQLAKGNVNDESMIKITEILTRGFKPKPAEEQAKDKGAAAGEGAAAGIDSDRADSVMKAGSGAYKEALSDADKTSLNAYQQTKDNPKAKPADKENALKAAQGALGRLNAAMEGKGDATYEAANAASLAGITGAIGKRREQLKKAKIEGTAADNIIISEFSAPEIAGNIKKQNGDSTKIDGVSSEGKEMDFTPTTAPAATEVAPAGGAPKAKPKAAPAGGAPKTKTKATTPAEAAGPPAPPGPTVPAEPAAPVVLPGSASTNPRIISRDDAGNLGLGDNPGVSQQGSDGGWYKFE